MANIPKVVRKDAKSLAKKRRENGDKPIGFAPKSDIKPFNEAGIKQDEYLTNYSVKHSNAPKRAKEFHAARAPQRLQSRIDMIKQMDAEYAEHKAWKAANPNYVYPGGTGDRK